jgi:uncharacterized protein (TIGR00290 family)
VSQAGRVLLAWSSGKDSAFCLHVLREQSVPVVGLLTTMNAVVDRVAMHAVRRTLLEAQAGAVGLPLHTVPLPHPCPHEAYQEAMGRALVAARVRGVTSVAFGDLFLEDVRRYREEAMAGTGLEPLFPLWGRDTRALAEEMIASGQKAILTCVDPRAIPAELAGRSYDRRLLRDLPTTADPCGENGEFHSFAWDGPTFAHALDVEAGETMEREGFVFADVLPAARGAREATSSGTHDDRMGHSADGAGSPT